MPDTKKSKVCTDDLRRARVVSDAAFKAASLANVVFIEVPTGSQSARAMAGYGICLGIMASLRTCNLPFIELGPREIKLATLNDLKASKASIIKHMVTLYPDLNWPRKTIKGAVSLTSGKAEHMADAIGVIHAGLLTNEFSQLMALRR